MSLIAIGGSIAQRVGYGGHAWVLLQYLLGFRALGHDVLFIDRLTREMAAPGGRDADPAIERGARWLTDLMRRTGLDESYALLLGEGRETVGLPRAAVKERLAESAVLINVMGFLKDEEILGAAPQRAFLDIDPGFGQMWADLGLSDLFRGHDSFVTIGENIGTPGCPVPTCGLDWIKTRQPVVLDWWPPVPAGSAFTSIASWRGPYGPIDYKGTRYGLRVHEFRKFAELPRLTGEQFELALDIDDFDTRDRALLEQGPWELVDPVRVAGDPWRYRSYIQCSEAEFMVAKNLYVETGCGWFSDRSVCYLSSGKPVLAQDTGFTNSYPTGEGLLSFGSIEEAVAGVHEIKSNPAKHAKAARAIAEECFDSRKVLSGLLDDLGVV